DHPEHYRLMFERMHEVEPTEQGMLEAFASFDQLVGNVAAARSLRPLGVGTDVEVAQQLWSALHGAVSLELLGIGFADDPDEAFEAMLDALLAGMQVGARGR
ncbi:MAG: WHG domain-containing protein, partial [Actinobacteria bacterium]|nr:WHG domain-containing protein [Actinomycetota bacterium]